LNKIGPLFTKHSMCIRAYTQIRKQSKKLCINQQRTSIDGLCSIACEVPAKSNAVDAATLNAVST